MIQSARGGAEDEAGEETQEEEEAQEEADDAGAVAVHQEDEAADVS